MVIIQMPADSSTPNCSAMIGRAGVTMPVSMAPMKMPRRYRAMGTAQRREVVMRPSIGRTVK